MKLMKVLAVALMFIGLTACSGSGSFSPEKCKQLEEKIHSSATLTENDYDEMIGQMGAALEVMADKKKEFGDDNTKQAEYIQSEEGKQIISAVLGFGIYLDAHQKDLTPGNVKKLEAFEKRFKELND